MRIRLDAASNADTKLSLVNGSAVNGHLIGIFYDYEGQPHYCDHKHETEDEALKCAEARLAEFKRTNPPVQRAKPEKPEKRRRR